MDLTHNNSAAMPDNHISSALMKTSNASHHDKLVAAARKWVAQSFFEPVLKAARENPFHKNRLSGGKGAETMGSLQDEFLAGEMASGLHTRNTAVGAHSASKTGNKLVDSLVKRLEANSAYAKQKHSPLQMEREGADRVKPDAASIKLMANGGAHVATAL
jgi:hypothetical protein